MNGEPRSLLLRYRVDPVGACLDTLSPERSMDDSEDFSHPGRTAWATCEGLKADSTRSDLITPPRFEIAIGSALGYTRGGGDSP